MEYQIYLLKILILSISLSLFAQEIDISSISKKIYQNECSSNPKYLVHWNRGENFPSLGIGHFIWYPKGVHERFDESFPTLIQYMQNRGVKTPLWLTKEAPWQNRAEMIHDKQRVEDLRKFLIDTKDIQASFMQQRLDNWIAKIDSKIAKRNFIKVSNEKMGYYLLIDYLNFKGSGLKKSERYKNQGWGLLQVLECMKSTLYPKIEFAKCAKKLLKLRVKNSPKSRGENRRLKGWFNRIDTYIL
jgi:hypothetical protein